MGEFAKKANELLETQPDWKAMLASQQKRLGTYIPSSEEEAQAKAQANLEALKQTMYSLGYQMRAKKREGEEPLLQDVGGGMPGREVVIDLPAIKRGWYDPCLRSKQAADQIPGGLADNKPDSDYDKKQLAMGAKVEMEHVNDKAKAREISKDHLEEIPDYYTRLDEMEEEAKSEKRSGVLDEMLAPVGMAGESALASIAQAVSDKTREGRRVTTDPSTLVSYYPSMAMSAPRAFHQGYTKAEEDADKVRFAALEKQLAKARKEYERALSEEYAARGTAKTAGELIDGIAQHHVKCGDGELNQVAGAYLALASLLGYGAHEASRAWVSSRDPRQQKFEAVKEELRRKRMRQPSPILVDIPEPISADLEAKT
jgi:hypothetical protein